MAIIRKVLNQVNSRSNPSLVSSAWCDIDDATSQGTVAGIDNDTPDIAHTCVITRLDRNVSYTTTAQPGQHLTQNIPQNGNNRVVWTRDTDGEFGTPTNLQVSFTGARVP